jgi:hypothetical protein
MTHISASIQSAPLTKNRDGAWEPAIVTSTDRLTPVDGIEVRNLDGHGIINLRLLHSANQMTTWATTWDSQWMDSSHANNFSRRVRQRINKVEVFEEGGYGITDLRFTSDTGEQSGWLAGNAVVDRANPSRFRGGEVFTYGVPAGKVLIGVAGKAQGRYGLVDLKFVLHDAGKGADVDAT